MVLSVSSASATPQTGRIWAYGVANVQLDEAWSFAVIPGTRYEYARSGDLPSKGRYLDEVFVGPAWTGRLGDLSLKVALQYYFLGYPRPGSYPLSHNLELVPTIDYRIGALSLSYRIIFHNTIYASVYPAGQRWGFGTVMRNLVQARYALAPTFSVLLGDEPWFGLIENGGTAYSSAGYWQRGFRLNRLYAGFDWKLGNGVTLSPQYVFEATFGPDGQATELGHYAFVTLGFNFKAY